MSRNHRKPANNALQNKRRAVASRGRNVVRIVGGRWRGRKIRFPADTGVRPTPDRVRETLFNWLAPSIQGARCLDLFAGSGVLGFEALSRGAASCTLIDREPEVIAHLERLAAELAPDAARVRRADAVAWLDRTTEAFDIVFVDPPFGESLLPAVLKRLARPGLLAPRALVYLECPAASGEPTLPGDWQLRRSGRAGEVGYHLAVGPAAPVPDRPSVGEAGQTGEQ